MEGGDWAVNWTEEMMMTDGAFTKTAGAGAGGCSNKRPIGNPSDRPDDVWAIQPIEAILL